MILKSNQQHETFARWKPRVPMFFLLWMVFKSVPLATTADDAPALRLRLWERGIVVQSATDMDRFAYLWFYEWHMFDAVAEGEHTRGSAQWQWTLSTDGQRAHLKSKSIQLQAQVKSDSVDLRLEITNESQHQWPEIASIIPCWNPGDGRTVPDNAQFLDQEHQRTFFVSNQGLENLIAREIHFNRNRLEAIQSWEKERDDGKFIFANKWPPSDSDAIEGLIIRESQDEEWVMGIAWDSFISAQGHNPWKCMHLSVCVGPLDVGETKIVRGKLYLSPGSKEDVWARYRADFSR